MNVGNKGFPGALNNASGDASGKPSFPTHHEGVGKNTSGKGVFPDAVNSASGAASGIGVFPDAATKTERRRKRKEKKKSSLSFKFPFVPPPSVADRPRRCSSPPSATLGCVGYPAVMVAFVVWRVMDKGWMKLRNKLSLGYRHGVTQFLEFAKFHVDAYGRQYELAERRRQPVDRVELFRETHVRAGTFVSQAAEDAHNQMLELQSQPTPEGSQPLSEDEICDQVLGRRPGYSKGLGWGPKPKARGTASASSSSTSYSQSTQKEIELQAKLHEALERIEVQDRNHQALASQVEAMKKMIEDLTRAQQGPPHDP
ncbi:CACTA en-spm transposon protein [Cucumis melo var. makuwa]|uniref:CACTA en-spm transposon protein n=1 Tax=Cucumis melo var. makuwa TaxID=1194695 RepID=A0A5A7SKU2_CUCMM|nr:CACTA en-spm transposon protein [Cucumis melo var. makuwa]